MRQVKTAQQALVESVDHKHNLALELIDDAICAGKTGLKAPREHVPNDLREKLVQNGYEVFDGADESGTYTMISWKNAR